MSRFLLNDDNGISTIVGAMLLILIVVASASGLAVVVSEMQKDEIERQSHISAVENEELRFLSLELSGNSSYWESAALTIHNLNTEDSKIVGISINDVYAANYTADGKMYDKLDRLRIPATRSEKVSLNFSSNFTTPLSIMKDEPITIGISTSLLNTFSDTFIPPTPIITLEIETEDLGVVERDVLVLDGDSQSFDDGLITSWEWNIWDASKTNPQGNFNDNINLTKISESGMQKRIVFNSTGPFRINLTVEDDTKMVATSKNVTVPMNTNFNPPTNLIASYSDPLIDVNVTDIEGDPLEGIVVNFLRIHGNISVNTWSNTTDVNGNTQTIVTSGNESGTIRVTSGKLPYIEVAI